MGKNISGHEASQQSCLHLQHKSCHIPPWSRAAQWREDEASGARIPLTHPLLVYNDTVLSKVKILFK